jgi:hypothetical protein
MVLALLCLALSVPVGLVFMTSLGIPGLGVRLPLVWYPAGWALRCVRVEDDRIVEVRLWPFRRSWPKGSVESVALIPRTLGWASLPATSLAVQFGTDEVWFPTLQAWAITRRALTRAEARAAALAGAIGVPWTDRTAELDGT